MIRDLARSLGAAALFIFLVIGIALRSASLGIISIVPNVFPLAGTGALLALAGAPLQFTSVLVFTVCLGIAVDDTIHFLVHFRREMKTGRDIQAAIRGSIASVGHVMIITTLILIAGLCVLLLSGMPTLRLFGLLSIVALGLALLADLFFLPALLLYFRKYIGL